MIILAPGEVLEVTLSPIAKEMLRRQRLADAREADPTLADTWDGSTTQPDIDSHEFPIDESCIDCCDLSTGDSTFPIAASCGNKGCDHINPDCRCCGDCIECNE